MIFLGVVLHTIERNCEFSVSNALRRYHGNHPPIYVTYSQQPANITLSAKRALARKKGRSSVAIYYLIHHRPFNRSLEADSELFILGLFNSLWEGGFNLFAELVLTLRGEKFHDSDLGVKNGHVVKVLNPLLRFFERGA